MKRSDKTASKAVRTRALQRGLSAAPTAEAAGGTRQRTQATRAKKTALQWYADRGALVEADEDAALNDARLYAGEALARLHEQAYRRARVTARYSAEARGGTGGAEDSFVRSEHARQRFEEKFRALPSRTRAVVRLCVVEDEFVGRSRMERLRCGLDKLVELHEQKKVIQNDTKGIDERTIV